MFADVDQNISIRAKNMPVLAGRLVLVFNRIVKKFVPAGELNPHATVFKCALCRFASAAGLDAIFRCLHSHQPNWKAYRLLGIIPHVRPVRPKRLQKLLSKKLLDV